MTHQSTPTNSESLAPFLAAAKALGPEAAALGAIVEEAWAAQRDFLVMAAAVRLSVFVCLCVCLLFSLGMGGWVGHVCARSLV